MKSIRPLLLLLLCAFCLIQTACAKQTETPPQIVEALLSELSDAPSGVLYHSQAEEGSESYLSPSLLRSLYGDEAETYFANAEAYAIYLSSCSVPCELAIIQCYSTTDANRIEALCLDRAEELRVALRGTVYEVLSGETVVVAKGRSVAFLMCEGAQRIVKDVLRRI